MENVAKTKRTRMISFIDKIKQEQQIQELTEGTKEISAKTKMEKIIENETNLEEAISALQILGYNKKEIEKALEKVEKAGLTTEEIIKKGLVELSK